MTLTIDNETYNLEIVKKSTTKNIYTRVKDDLTIYVTCNTLTSNKKATNFRKFVFHIVTQMILTKVNIYDTMNM